MCNGGSLFRVVPTIYLLVFIYSTVELVVVVVTLAKCCYQTLNLAQQRNQMIGYLPVPKPLFPNYCPVYLQLNRAIEFVVAVAVVSQLLAVNSLALTEMKRFRF